MGGGKNSPRAFLGLVRCAGECLSMVRRSSSESLTWIARPATYLLNSEGKAHIACVKLKHAHRHEVSLNLKHARARLLAKEEMRWV